jgi:drug/metabolite transporter (DMT)-like permease
MRQQARGKSGAVAVFLLLVVTVVWGSTFVIVKSAVSHMAVMDFLAWRFVIATLAMLIIRPGALGRLSFKGYLHGAVAGLALGGGYMAQTFGLQHTSAAVSGFLTGMYVVLTPLLLGLFLRRRVGSSAWAATLLAGGGLAVISLTRLGFGLGEWLTLVCALCFALQIVALGEWAGAHDPFGLCTVQLATAALCCVVGAVAGPGLGPPPSFPVWGAVLATAVLATALAFLIQTWAQVHMAPTRVAIILTMEPVFAGVFAVLAGERLSWRLGIGGAMVLGAMYLVELLPERAKEPTAT